MLKKDIAARMRLHRDSLDKKEKNCMDQVIHAELNKHIESYQHIAIYASFGSEIDTTVLIDTWLQEGKSVYLPRVEGKIMNFYQVINRKDLKKNRMGIYEPVPNTAISQDLVEVFVVPMLAFNRDRYRIGYGGGYYDRILSNTKALKVGIAYDFQFVDNSFEMDYDIPMDIIITNEES